MLADAGSVTECTNGYGPSWVTNDSYQVIRQVGLASSVAQRAWSSVTGLPGIHVKTEICRLYWEHEGGRVSSQAEWAGLPSVGQYWPQLVSSASKSIIKCFSHKAIP